MAFVSAESGKSFDPKIVEVLERVYRDIDRKTKTTKFEPARLSKDLPISNNSAPGAGYEYASQTIADSPRADEFLASISAARQEAQVLYEVAQDLGNSLSLEETLSVVAGRLHKIIPLDAIAVWIVTRTEANGKVGQILRRTHHDGVGAAIIGQRQRGLFGDQARAFGQATSAPDFSIR